MLISTLFNPLKYPSILFQIPKSEYNHLPKIPYLGNKNQHG